MKILLIDNHVLFREGLRHVLQRMAVVADEILEAGDLAGGLRLAGQHPGLGLVLLEMNSPGSGGAISVKLFRLRYPYIPLVVVSGEEDRSVINKALSYGASSFVGKHSTEAALLDAVGRAISGALDAPPQSGAALRAKSGVSGSRRSNSNEYGLTARQMDILKHLAAGLSNKDIARVADLTEGTVKAHLAAVRKILRVRNRMEAALVADYLGLAGAPGCAVGAAAGHPGVGFGKLADCCT